MILHIAEKIMEVCYFHFFLSFIVLCS